MPNATADYYEVLGVARGADAKTIKRAFRSQAQLLHPDVSSDPDAEQKFRELADAYSALSKPASRVLYDRFGYRGRGAWAASPGAAQAFHGLFEFWERSKRRERANEDVAEIELGFYEAARGGRRTVTYVHRGACCACAVPAAACPSCGGRGTIRESDDGGSVRILQLVSCEACAGSGSLATASCEHCEGSGEIESTREAEVTIPSGVEDGARFPLAEDGPHVVIHVRPQPRDSAALRAIAALGLALALAFLALLLLG